VLRLSPGRGLSGELSTRPLVAAFPGAQPVAIGRKSELLLGRTEHPRLIQNAKTRKLAYFMAFARSALSLIGRAPLPD
jgi:hypothetical protein